MNTTPRGIQKLPSTPTTNDEANTLIAQAKTLRVSRRPERTRAELLDEIQCLQDDAYVSSRHAAAYVGASEHSLAQWRKRKYGPEFVKNNKFIRYQIKALKQFMGEQPNSEE